MKLYDRHFSTVEDLECFPDSVMARHSLFGFVVSTVKEDDGRYYTLLWEDGEEQRELYDCRSLTAAEAYSVHTAMVKTLESARSTRVKPWQKLYGRYRHEFQVRAGVGAVGPETFNPNWASPPGNTLKAFIAMKGLTVFDFAQLYGLDHDAVVSVLDGGVFAPELALGLEAAGVSSAGFWMRREALYRLALVRLAQEEGADV